MPQRPRLQVEAYIEKKASDYEMDNTWLCEVRRRLISTLSCIFSGSQQQGLQWLHAKCKIERVSLMPKNR
jgi:hypothetical protein